MIKPAWINIYVDEISHPSSVPLKNPLKSSQINLLRIQQFSTAPSHPDTGQQLEHK